MTRIKLCAADEVAPGTALKVETGDLVLAVFNVDGAFYVTRQVHHGPGCLSEGYIDGDVVSATYNGQFSIGPAVISPPTWLR
jgi:nitrite reductase/ring-hydroxylating ferredoxin subunit